LKGVLGVVEVVDDTPTNAQNHWAVTTNQDGKSHFVLLVDEGF
jgi:hypothetical protein